jgi:hypothetical protein
MYMKNLNIKKGYKSNAHFKLKTTHLNISFNIIYSQCLNLIALEKMSGLVWIKKNTFMRHF